MLKDGALGGQTLDVRGRATIVAVDAHVIGPSTVDDVEDDVGHVGGTCAAESRCCPQGHGAGALRFRLQRQGHGLPRQMGQIHGALSPSAVVGVGLFQQGFVLVEQ